MSSPTPSHKPLLRALRGEVVSPPPIWLMRQAGRYLPEYREVRRRAGGFLDLCYAPALASEVTLQPIRRFGLDAAILFSDILVVPHALGVRVDFREGDGPRLAPVRVTADVPVFDAARFHAHLGPVYETVGRIAAELAADVALIGFAGAPWTIAAYMCEGRTSRDFAAAKAWAFREPDAFARLIEVIVEASAAYLVAQVRSGVEVVQIFDSWAGLVPAGVFDSWVVKPTRALVDRLRGAGVDVPVIGFPRAAGVAIAEYAAGAGVDAVSLDPGVPPAWAAATLQPRCTVQGNLDPIYLLAGGAAMEAEARAIVRALAGGPFVFNLGHGVLPETPPANVARLVETVRGMAR